MGIRVKPVPEIETISATSQGHVNIILSRLGPKDLTLEAFVFSKWILGDFDTGQCARITSLHFMYFQFFSFSFYLVQGKVKNFGTFLLCSLY